jgi:hypothetical protein
MPRLLKLDGSYIDTALLRRIEVHEMSTLAQSGEANGNLFAVGDPATHVVLIELAQTGEREIAVHTESYESAEKVADILAQELTRAGAVQGVLSMEDLANTALSSASV